MPWGYSPSLLFSSTLAELRSESHNTMFSIENCQGSVYSTEWLILLWIGSDFIFFKAVGFWLQRHLSGKGDRFEYLQVKTSRWIPLFCWVKSSSFSWRDNIQFILWLVILQFFLMWLIIRMFENRYLISVFLPVF